MTSPQNIPWKTLNDELGEVPFFVIEFDKDGNCTSPVARDRLIEASGSRSDVLLFSHGWNNDWAAATARYDRFVERFVAVRRARWAPPTRDFRPVLAGVFWPSTALVAPWEGAPDIAAGGGLDPHVAALADELDPAARAQFLAMTTDPLRAEPHELAKLLAPLLVGDDEVGKTDPPDPAELVTAWQAVAADTAGEAPEGPAGGFIPDEPPTGEATPQEAGFNPLDWIRSAVRATTVWLMKDRAGRVGGHGVAAMLRMLTEASDSSRISLVGHSYGCKVVLSALCSGAAPNRDVDSVLLLEPALSGYAFTDDIDGHPGGYRSALERVRLPIISTYSSHDAPLTKFFHLAVRRDADLGEAVIAGQPPSKYAALGGYGPQGVDAEWITMPALGGAYPLATSKRIIAVNGSAYIASHGAVETPETAWALLSQLQA